MSRVRIAIFLLGFGISYSSFAEISPPNILFILTDDQGYGDLGCYGSETIATPNIDRLCEEGMKFESFYVHNRCSPTRAAFMTGCHAGRVGADKVIYRKDRMGINPHEITIAEILRKEGYATGIIGKWHLGEWEVFNPVNHGFDYFFGFMECDDKRTTAIYRNKEIVEKVKSKTDGAHSPRLLAEGIKFIKANRDRPFFLYYSSPLPHTKWKPNSKFSGTSVHGTYGDVVQEIDWQVGELLDALDDLELTNKTLVIFASDNGPQLNADGHGSPGIFRGGKWTNFEGGIRVPCLMRWPGKIPRGESNKQITGIIDMLPTLSSLAGAEPPSDRQIDGRDITPYLFGKKRKNPIHDTFIVPGATIRHEDWKLFVKKQNPGGNGSRGMQGRTTAAAGSLFNLRKDPSETTDLSSTHKEKVQELMSLMNTFTAEFENNTRKIGSLDSDAGNNHQNNKTVK